MGRPSDFTQQMADAICAELADGRSLRDICSSTEMPDKATVFRWLAKDAQLRDQYEKQGNPYYASARLWDDGVILPQDTRIVLGLSLAATRHAPLLPTQYGVFRM